MAPLALGQTLFLPTPNDLLPPLGLPISIATARRNAFQEITGETNAIVFRQIQRGREDVLSTRIHVFGLAPLILGGKQFSVNRLNRRSQL
jgi:hypothetical protein